MTDAITAAPVRYPDAVGSLDLASLQEAYRVGRLVPEDVVDAIYERIESRGDDGVWIQLVPRDEARRAARAVVPGPARPLAGIPFAIKDNMDVAGLPTTAACPAFAYVADETATVVARLEAAGAILIGKTNLDQFATGLNGTRTPYGIPATPFDPTMISGGSSSGSAVAVSAGLVSFALGTDTAGSGRVPAAFTGTVGVKPSPGLASTAGIVPACHSLDCPSVFALTVADGARVLAVISGPDAADPWSRPAPIPAPEPRPAPLDGLVLGVPFEAQLGLDVDSGYREAWNRLVFDLQVAGALLVEIDLEPFFTAGELLYQGPWLAERLSGIEHFVAAHPEALHPVTRTLLEAGHSVMGTDAFRGLHELQRLRAETSLALEGVAALLTPTAPRTFSVAEMLADPIALNSALGRFTTFGNLLSLAAVAVPGGLTARGMPFGVSVQTRWGQDERALSIAAAVEGLVGLPLAATGLSPAGAASRATSVPSHPSAGGLSLAVVGAHLSGMPLHPRLLELGAQTVAATTTSADYRLYALAGVAKPGLVRVDSGGAAIELEVYRLPFASIGELLAEIDAPLSLGTIRLADGSSVHGFLCEPAGLGGARDITEFGGWRGYLARDEG
ncbi:allophanate hydrolase [Pseudolysinimonas sp.]|uniref:allophanate hydrolase n=1 Tax=Pseudolysinimonas sp. TaxID=2680009 RepID=UPI00286BE560|nr:allophanate hydrolase [Pseudolysinimonas sp.]